LSALEVTSGSNITRLSALETASGSAITRLGALEVTSGSNITRLSSIESTTGSLNTASGSAITRLSSIESKTGSYATTGSNTFVDGQYLSSSFNPTGFSTTASLYTDGGLRVTRDAYISGTLYLNNVTVFGTQSVAYISSSQLNIGTNLITVNTDTPSIRFGGLAVYDSGSTGLTGSILWDSQNNHWVYTNPSGSTYSGGMFISGPRASSLGTEQGTTSCMLLAGQGGDHLTSSAIYHSSTVTCIPNTLIGNVACFAGNICSNGNVLVGGTGTTNYLPKFTAASTIGNSLFTDNGINGAFGNTNYSAGTGVRTFNITAPQFAGIGFWTGTSQYTADIFAYESTGNLLLNADPTNTLGTTNIFLDVDGTRIATFNTACVTLSRALSGTSATFSGNMAIGGTTITDGSMLNVIGNQSSVNIGLVLNNTNATYPKIYGIQNVNNNLVFYDYSTSSPRLTIASSGAATFACSISATSAVFSSTLTGVNAIFSGRLGAGISSDQTYASIFVGGDITTGANQYAILADPQLSGTSNSYAIFANARIKANTAVTNAFGIYIPSAEKITGATITNNYALYIANQTSGATLNYSIYSSGGANYFGGCVGIGTNNPGSILHVKGGTVGGADFGAELRVWENSFGAVLQGFTYGTTAAFLGNFRYNINTPASSVTNYFTAGHGILFHDGVHIFSSAPGGSSGGTFTPAERMTITNGGDVYIGNTTISATQSAIFLQKSGIITTVRSYSSGTINLVEFYKIGADIGAITYNGTNTLYGGTSDYRLKEDLKDYNALNIINQLKTYNFKWKDTDVRDYGMMAHELQEILPNYVSGEKDAIREDGSIKSQNVDYSKLVPVLVKGMQEQQCTINTLKNCLGIV
jgi:hypothetical protein